MYINYSTPSGVKTATAQILVGPGALHGIDVTPPTTGITTLVVYDSGDGSTAGKLVLSEMYVDAGLSTLNHEYFTPVAVQQGLYCVFTDGGSSNYVVRFSKG